ncbi:23S rRNA (uracil(1939)-C(5))-methyltransferase RlmD [Aliikangiella coralliicola]|uniref:23S rRNA (uracil(1939)-C(5))-methyltransferase RlmD n=1 Tax=Aliikangiella coralliicola TaxID=2592383 RepID=A0A545TSV4_9GAMM|nr:23S rRNA (uracil(1939)-C(5))-methyltransferase RlmD [Aliikangiella coralliicola]TQV80297.1 23S rRNA (uracil(1939)-C(5))-methyltransferase RlmD [Aliikangiella coralliicola]
MSRKYRKKKSLPTEPVVIDIDSLSHEGRGVGRIDGKTVFVDGALAGERVEMLYTYQRGKFDEGRIHRVITSGDDRVEPPCKHFEVCGGCSMQHMSSEAQISHKQSILQEQLAHFAQTQPEEWLPPLQADLLGYRRKARLGVRYVMKKERTLIGFREKYSNFLADIDSCPVLVKQVSDLLVTASQLIDTLDGRQFIPQIEVSCGDDKVALIIRHLKPMSDSDRAKWFSFAQENNLIVYLQPKGPDTITRLWPIDDEAAQLSYRLPEFGVELLQKPLDFAQVNASINRKMVPFAIELLDVQPEDQVLDLFCGLGNFTIPLATKAKLVVGVEGVQAMVERGAENARFNQLDNVEFYQADLTSDLSDKEWNQRQYNKILIDPARSGALEVINNIVRFNAEKIVYVSCNPATLARDTGELVKSGYRLCKAGVMDMFPHTTHVESIALFEKV